VVHLEAGALEAVEIVDLGAADVRKAGAVDEQRDPVALEHLVVVAALVEGQLVLEAGAAATPNADPEAGHLGDPALLGQELANLLGTSFAQRDHHFTQCSGQWRGRPTSLP